MKNESRGSDAFFLLRSSDMFRIWINQEKGVQLKRANLKSTPNFLYCHICFLLYRKCNILGRTFCFQTAHKKKIYSIDSASSVIIKRSLLYKSVPEVQLLKGKFYHSFHRRVTGVTSRWQISADPWRRRLQPLR